MRDRPFTPGCYICDPAAFSSDEEPCQACEQEWIAYYYAAYERESAE